MTTLHALDEFFDDLISFLESLVQSCPASFEKYKQEKNAAREAEKRSQRG